jgi:phosphoribosyl-AMP cyclohydrolase
MLELDFNKGGGLLPAIVQDYSSGEVLMLAYLNPESWALTRATGVAHYWSRSRNRLWKKGESSGHLQEVKEVRVDCDGDTVLLKVRQAGGAACHTGYRSCFYRRLEGGELRAEGVKVFEPGEVYGAGR